MNQTEQKYTDMVDAVCRGADLLDAMKALLLKPEASVLVISMDDGSEEELDAKEATLLALDRFDKEMTKALDFADLYRLEVIEGNHFPVKENE